MPLSNVVFHFWLIVEIILTLLIITYMYGSNIVSYINLLFDSNFTSFQKMQKLFYEPVLRITRMVQPQIEENALFWLYEIPLAIIIIIIYVISPLLSDNMDFYKSINDIYTFIVGTRKNNYNFTQITNNYGNYIPFLLILIAIFVILNQFFLPIFSFIIVLLVFVISYTGYNMIMYLSTKTNDASKTAINFVINDYIFIVIFILIWVMLILFIFSSNKTIVDLYRSMM